MAKNLGTIGIEFRNDDRPGVIGPYPDRFEAALAKFPDYRRAQKNLAFALVRDGKFREAIAPLSRTISLGGGDGGDGALVVNGHRKRLLVDVEGRRPGLRQVDGNRYLSEIRNGKLRTNPTVEKQ